jgi:hypothetical protein
MLTTSSGTSGHKWAEASENPEPERKFREAKVGKSVGYDGGIKRAMRVFGLRWRWAVEGGR